MISLIALLFISLTLAPLLMAIGHSKRNQGEVLMINQSKTKDPRYFGKSFASLVEQNVGGTDDHRIKLSQTEAYLDTDLRAVDGKVIDKLVIARDDFHGSLSVEEYEKEIYGARDIILNGHDDLIVRAAYSKGNMIIGSHTHVVRWLDAAGTLAIHDHCDLGISASSAISMSIGKKSKFRRLYSPKIKLGQYPEDDFSATDGKDPHIYQLPIQTDRTKYIKQITAEQINDQGIVNFTVVAPQAVNVPEKIIIQGDVRSAKGVRLQDGAVVCGNIFAEKDIHLGKNTCVLGNVFSQENIYFAEGAVAGQKGKGISVIARGGITFEKRNFVFGFISCEKQGLILGNGDDATTETARASVFLSKPTETTLLKFTDRHEFEHLNNQDFRHYHALEKVIIPQDVTVVPRSMFFNCQALTDVILPEKLVELGAYSFANCKSLRDITLDQCLNLQALGVSVFKNCVSLESVIIPSTVETIAGAAFSGCTNLKRVTFAETSQLTTLADHCFRGCESLAEIKLGEQVVNIGVSAFKECFALKKIFLPETCQNEPGILELPREILQFYPVAPQANFLENH